MEFCEKTTMTGLTIGHLRLNVPFFQTALSGYSDRAFRRINKEYGSPLTMPGVMLAKSVINPAVIRKGLIDYGDDEHIIGGQLMGEDPQVMAQAARIMEEHGYDFVDLNFACPVPKVLRRKRGGYLMSQPQNLLSIFRSVRDAVKCPVTMKIRIGFDHDEESKERFWLICEQSVSEGVDALMIHGRSVAQRFRGFADWNMLREVKEAYPKTTIVGSGNLFSAKAVVDRLRQSNLDAVLIARGCIGNPWIFREAAALLEGAEPFVPPTIGEQGEVMLKHFDEVAETYPAKTAIGIFRKFSVRYVRRHPERQKVQEDLLAAEDEAQFHTAIKKWYDVG